MGLFRCFGEVRPCNETGHAHQALVRSYVIVKLVMYRLARHIAKLGTALPTLVGLIGVDSFFVSTASRPFCVNALLKTLQINRIWLRRRANRMSCNKNKKKLYLADNPLSFISPSLVCQIPPLSPVVSYCSSGNADVSKQVTSVDNSSYRQHTIIIQVCLTPRGGSPL